jgi:hypothetical protein
MGKHFGLTVPDIKAYIGIRHNGGTANNPAAKNMRAIVAGGILKLRLSVAGLYNVALFDARGRRIMHQTYTVGKGKVLNPALNIRALPAGIYTLKTSTGSVSVVQKIAYCR